jgi:vacuolar-type H+-ATPase subunit I/STV1
MRMDNSWEDFRKKFKTGISAVYRKADELTRIGKLRLEIVAVKRDIEKAFIEMGGRLYHQISEESRYDTKDDPQIAELVKKIRGMEDRLEEIEKKIREIQDIANTDSSED